MNNLFIKRVIEVSMLIAEICIYLYAVLYVRVLKVMEREDGFMLPTGLKRIFHISIYTAAAIGIGIFSLLTLSFLPPFSK